MILIVFSIIAYQPVGPVHAQELVHQRLELGQLHLFFKCCNDSNLLESARQSSSVIKVKQFDGVCATIRTNVQKS